MSVKENEKLKLHPDKFDLECTTVWAFPKRGNWATHESAWRGNWAPEVARNLILRYSAEGDYLLDCMIGGGTTAIEAKILNRHITCVDVNEDALNRTTKLLNFDSGNKSKQRIVKCDARKMNFIMDGEIDLVLTHPPYADIIKYSNGKISEDLSNINDIDEFVEQVGLVAQELYRVLKSQKFCAILIGDTRRKKMYQPMAFRVMNEFLKANFKLREDIIKKQFNCMATDFWTKKSKEANFLLIMHEHLFIFQK